MRQLHLIGVCLVGWVLVSCSDGAGVDHAALDAKRGLTGGIGAPVVHRFDRGATDLEAWHNPAAVWTVEEGRVVGRKVHNQTLWRKAPIAQTVRIEFDAQAGPDGDIRFEIFGDGEHHESGYVLAYNAWRGVAHVMARMDEHGTHRVTAPVEGPIDPNATYRMAVVRTDASLRWFVGGKLLLEYIDEAPLAGHGHEHFGLGGWAAEVRFDNVRVFTLAGEVPQ